jgi:hypothetical protein
MRFSFYLILLDISYFLIKILSKNDTSINKYSSIISVESFNIFTS